MPPFYSGDVISGWFVGVLHVAKYLELRYNRNVFRLVDSVRALVRDIRHVIFWFRFLNQERVR